MTSLSKSSNEPSQIILAVPLTGKYDNNTDQYVLVPTSCEYWTSGCASWKIAVSWADNKARVTLYCCRKSSSDTLVTVYSVSLSSTTNPHTQNVHQQGHVIFSGPWLETTAGFDLNVDSILAQHIYSYGNTSLQVDITSLEASADGMEIYEDAFSSVGKAQLFSESSPFPWDCVVIFSDHKQAYVQKNFLSMHSKFWKEEFVEDKDVKEFLLDDVDYDDFTELLSVIYPTAHPITVKNVETLSKLAYEFEMSELFKRCDIFLMANSAKFGKSKLLLLAQNYKLERLQAQCISEYKSMDDIKTIKAESEYDDLDDRTKRMLLDAIIGINSSMLSDASVTSYASHVLATNEARATKILNKLSSLSSCPSDIVLVVGNKQIHAHKQYLSLFSDFFYNMFHSGFKESRESEITLEEVRYEEMVELLSVVYPSDDYSINETNIATIVKLADRFVMPIVLERCKKELKNSNKINGALKLWLAQRYNFTDLQTRFASICNSIEDVNKLKDETEFELLDDKMRALILESITK